MTRMTREKEGETGESPKGKNVSPGSSVRKREENYMSGDKATKWREGMRKKTEKGKKEGEQKCLG